MVHPGAVHRRPLGPRTSMGFDLEANVGSRLFIVDILPSHRHDSVMPLDPSRREVRGEQRRGLRRFANHGQSPVASSYHGSIPSRRVAIETSDARATEGPLPPPRVTERDRLRPELGPHVRSPATGEGSVSDFLANASRLRSLVAESFLFSSSRR